MKINFLKLFNYLFVIVIATFLFPISPYLTKLFGIVGLVVYISFISKLFKYSSGEHFIKIFFKMCFLNILGIIFKYFIQYGEYSMISSLTIGNIFTYIIILPAITSLLSLIMSKCNSKF